MSVYQNSTTILGNTDSTWSSGLAQVLLASATGSLGFEVGLANFVAGSVSDTPPDTGSWLGLGVGLRGSR